MNYRKWHEKALQQRERKARVEQVEQENPEPTFSESLEHWTGLLFGSAVLCFMSIICVLFNGKLGTPPMWWIASGLWLLWYVAGWFITNHVRAHNTANGQLPK